MRDKLLVYGLPEIVEKLLERNGHVLERAESGEDAIELLKEDLGGQHGFAALVVTTGREDTGLLFPRLVRVHGVTCPIIMVDSGAQSGAHNLGRSALRTQVLNSGGDDCLCHPVNMSELEASITACVRRGRGLVCNLVTAGPITVNLTSLNVKVNGLPVYLTLKELQMVHILASRKGMTVTKEQFIGQIYTSDSDQPETKIIDVFIHKIRVKLDEVRFGAGAYLHTIWGRGYQLSDEPQEVDDNQVEEPDMTPIAMFAASQPDSLGQVATQVSLTGREIDILQSLLRGESNKQIARGLGRSDATIKAQLRSLLQKIGATNRTQAALWAKDRGIGISTGMAEIA